MRFAKPDAFVCVWKHANACRIMLNPGKNGCVLLSKCLGRKARNCVAENLNLARVCKSLSSWGCKVWCAIPNGMMTDMHLSKVRHFDELDRATSNCRCGTVNLPVDHKIRLSKAIQSSSSSINQQRPNIHGARTTPDLGKNANLDKHTPHNYVVPASALKSPNQMSLITAPSERSVADPGTYRMAFRSVHAAADFVPTHVY